jgi:hypothetical protein
MRSFGVVRTSLHHPARIHPALTSFADECCGMLARLVAYVSVLALVAIFGVHLWDQLSFGAAEPAARADWSVATRSYPAFAVSQSDISGKTETYEILRHPEGGRKDIFRWTEAGEKPVAELEIYRPGGELSPSGSAVTALAARMEPGAAQLEMAGVVDSKFGTIALLRVAGAPNLARSCLGFLKRFDQPPLRISGWTCQQSTLPARRAAIGCMLNRLILLTAGHEPKLAELFAGAELKRARCTGAAGSAADWVTAPENPRLRGVL